jgi:AbrB family looped-hinge helix DNA binding protein
MKQFVSSLSPKGQITIPQEVRKQLGLKTRDKVAIQVDADRVTISPARSRLDAIYQSVPALTTPRTWEEITELAADEHAEHVAREGLPRR